MMAWPWAWTPEQVETWSGPGGWPQTCAATAHNWTASPATVTSFAKMMTSPNCTPVPPGSGRTSPPSSPDSPCPTAPALLGLGIAPAAGATGLNHRAGGSVDLSGVAGGRAVTAVPFMRIELFRHVVEASTEERIPVNDSEGAYEILRAYTAAPAEAPGARRPGTGLTARISNAMQVMHVAWGTAWVVGYGLLFLRDSPGGRTFVPMPSWLPLTVLFVLLAGAGATTAVLGARVLAQEAADEHSARQGKWYGTAWLLGFAGLLLTVGKLTHGLSA